MATSNRILHNQVNANSFVKVQNVYGGASDDRICVRNGDKDRVDGGSGNNKSRDEDRHRILNGNGDASRAPGPGPGSLQRQERAASNKGLSSAIPRR